MDVETPWKLNLRKILKNNFGWFFLLGQILCFFLREMLCAKNICIRYDFLN